MTEAPEPNLRATSAGRDAGDSRGKILEVAETLFAQRGFEGVGMRELSATVGLSKSSLFHHFPTKLRLYEEVLDRAVGRVAEVVAPERLAQAGSAMDRLAGWIDGLTTALVESPGIARLLLRGIVEEDPFETLAERDPMPFELRLLHLIEDFQSMLREGIEAGEFRSVEIGDFTQSVIGTVFFHFASGEFGEGMVEGPIYSAAATKRRREETRNFICNGIRKWPSEHGEQEVDPGE